MWWSWKMQLGGINCRAVIRGTGRGSWWRYFADCDCHRLRGLHSRCLGPLEGKVDPRIWSFWNHYRFACARVENGWNCRRMKLRWLGLTINLVNLVRMGKTAGDSCWISWKKMIRQITTGCDISNKLEISFDKNSFYYKNSLCCEFDSCKFKWTLFVILTLGIKYFCSFKLIYNLKLKLN